jgi:chemotaxis protein CheD
MAQLSVGISDWKVCREPDTLITYALGSCVGICMYDREKHVAGLSHIMLPDSAASAEAINFNRMKFADTAIPDMFNKMIQLGANHTRITAKIAGGALMFTSASERFNIGERNVTAVKAALSKIRVPIIASDTGFNFGRTVVFFSNDGRVEVKSTIHGVKLL